MSMKSELIKNSILSNKINLKNFRISNLNKGKPCTTEDILQNYSQEIINECWASLCTNIIQNYQRGKGTLIKGFGLFTFKAPEVILQGTTNEYARDFRQREPIFIVSKELNERFCPGEYNKQNGIKYFTQKESKDISIVKINYAEMAYSLSISKDELTNIIKHLFSYINKSIINNTFKQKIMPGLGLLLNSNNIIAVKFDEELINNIKKKPQILNFTKKNILLDLDMDNAQKTFSENCKKPFKNIEYLKSSNSLITKCEKTAKDYLLKNYLINLKKYPEHAFKTIQNKSRTPHANFKFINESEENIKSINNKLSCSLSFLDEETLKSIEYFKGIMIKNSKYYDIKGSGLISKSEMIDALIKTNINNLDSTKAKLIVDLFNKTEQVEYMKFISLFIKKSKLALLKLNRNKQNINLKFNSYNETNYENFRRENFFNTINGNHSSTKIKIIKNSNDNKRASNNNYYQTLPNFNRTLNCFRKKNFENNKEEEINRCNSLEPKNKNTIKERAINFVEIQKDIHKAKKLLIPIVNTMDTIKRDYCISLDQKISSEELSNILYNYEILYPKKEVEYLVTFLEIPNKDAFSLNELYDYIKACKIMGADIELSELLDILRKLRDIIYINGGAKLLFNNEKNPKNTIDCDTFINIVKYKVPFTPEILKNAFIYMVKTDREFNMNDFNKYFDNPESKITFDESYYQKMMTKIIQKIYQRKFKAEEYFDHLLLYNISTNDKVITRLNWIKYLQKEKIDFKAEEIDKLFNWLDIKKDGVIDKEEFLQRYNHTIKPLSSLQNIILQNKLDIEDLAHHMNISKEKEENMDYETFRKKIKTLNYTYPESFIKNLFCDLISDKNYNKNSLINSKKFLDEINYIKPPEKYQSFTQNYMNKIRQRTTHDILKSEFEKFDKNCEGALTKSDYILVINKILSEYEDIDHMRFIRVTDMFDKHGNIKYPDVLDLIFFYNKEKLSDKFSNLCLVLSNILKNQCDNDVERLLYLISSGTKKKATSLKIHRPVTLEEVKKFLEKIKNPVDEKIILKLDIDADGVISFEDLNSVLKRFNITSYFKYTNNSTKADINIFSEETMEENKYQNIIKKLNIIKKMKSITDIGLFKIFDVDNDGFISSVDFNQAIDDLIVISPALKDQFFNYLDFYHNGLVDCETFMKRMIDYKTGDILIENNNEIEVKILERLKQFVIRNKNLSDNEIFRFMDKDCDGLINLDDLKLFIIDNLHIPEIEFDKAKLERVIMTLSLSKNYQIGLMDIRKFINLCNEKDSKADNLNLDLKDVFRITANQNLSNLKKNKDWTNDIIERFGMFVSEKNDSIEQFFAENTEKGADKFLFSDFIKFHEKNYELFNMGFNLTKDELLSIYTSLDSHKKKYLTLQDLKNKLQIFNFYNKMHIDIKNFLQESFKNGFDAFKFFVKDKKQEKNYITLKEYFDAIEIFFPNKYPTNTIIKYLNKYFGITLTIANNNKNELLNKKETISFSEFNYLYFDDFKFDEDFQKNKNSDTKLHTNRYDIAKTFTNKFTQKSQNNFFYSNLFKKKFEKLSNPFDVDPLTKIKRIIGSSKFNLDKFFETAAIECGNNNFIVNKYQFKNIIKKLNIGLTNLEIEQILFQAGKLDYNNMINLREFVRYLYNQNKTIEEGQKNIGKIIGKIKSLIYKYYSNPIICFHNNDKKNTGKIDFDKFKNIIFDMYFKNEEKSPSFTLIKNVFDEIDLRKDGILDLNEWLKAFGNYNSSLDPNEDKVSIGETFFGKKFRKKNNFRSKDKIENNRKVLREWESSRDISNIYQVLYKNRKEIKQIMKDKNYLIKFGDVDFVHSANFINILKDILPNINLSQTQWKMLVNIAQTERIDDLIDLKEFFKLIECSAKNMSSHPFV